MPQKAPMIFDGSNASVAFLDLVRATKMSPKAEPRHWAELIPTLLYGDALRYYESLPVDCQNEWIQLRDAMVCRFPGPVLNGGVIARSEIQKDQSGIPTAAQPPPVTASRIAPPPTTVPQEVDQDDTNQGMKESYVAGLVRRVSLGMGSRADPQITVHSFFIERVQWGKNKVPLSVTLIAKVDLNDREAVLYAKQTPLLTVKKSDVQYYRAGFYYYIHHGSIKIGVHHKVLWPREFRTSFKSYPRVTAAQVPAATRVKSEGHPLADFLYHGRPLLAERKHADAPTAGYNIQSFFQQSESNHFKNLANLTWMIDVV